MTRRSDQQLRRSMDHFRKLINEQGGQAAFVKALSKIGIERRRNTVSGWMNEKGHTYPEADHLVKIAGGFGVSVDWLLGRTERR